ncbi:TlyA family RNA methyltransferase [Candidatus Saccharibacteria bacterium]|nr:TlyA family RNA methyltransferase [Candidatus Saccharibacteria bacterium]
MNTGNEKSRGYYKIKGASSTFNFDSNFKGKIVLDIGSSTGGFTEYALEHGAKKVIAVEKGTNQMKSPLRNNPRVELHEKTDIFDFVCKPDIIVADVSFISLTEILKYAKDNLSTKDTDFLVMLKPQFEAEPKDLRNGVVKNETVRRNIIKNFEHWLKTNNFVIIKKHDNALQGKHGNIERFYWLKKVHSQTSKG